MFPNVLFYLMQYIRCMNLHWILIIDSCSFIVQISFVYFAIISTSYLFFLSSVFVIWVALHKYSRISLLVNAIWLGCFVTESESERGSEKEKLLREMYEWTWKWEKMRTPKKSTSVFVILTKALQFPNRNIANSPKKKKKESTRSA